MLGKLVLRRSLLQTANSAFATLSSLMAPTTASPLEPAMPASSRLDSQQTDYARDPYSTSTMQHTVPDASRTKSAKRKAAESLLAARYSSLQQFNFPHSIQPAQDPPAASASLAATAVATARPSATEESQHNEMSALKPGKRRRSSSMHLQPAILSEQQQQHHYAASSSCATLQTITPQFGSCSTHSMCRPSPCQPNLSTWRYASTTTSSSSSRSLATRPSAEGSSSKGIHAIGTSSGSGSGVTGSAKANGAEPVAVAACPSTCAHPDANGWCHMQVSNMLGSFSGP